MKAGMKHCVVGIVLALAGLWGGAIALHYAPPWLSFPIFTTAMVTGFVGVVIAGNALVQGGWF